MLELNISPNFTVADIHKIREYNYEMTKNMTKEECKKYYQVDIDYGRKRIAELRKDMRK